MPNTNTRPNTQKPMQPLKNIIKACPYDFPHPAIADPDGVGVVAVGGDLAPATILTAYSQGLFPWFNDDDDPIAWWSPDPRCVLDPNHYQPSKSLRKQAKKSNWITTVNADFEQVIFNCRLPRNYAGQAAGQASDETWITEEMQSAYLQLHDLGFAHSIEVWDANELDEPQELIGGLYGLKLGGIFCGESMFHRATNASKVAFWRLCQFCTQTGVKLIDCQLPNDHLMSLGATIMPRDEFLTALPSLINTQTRDWQQERQEPVKNIVNNIVKNIIVA